MAPAMRGAALLGGNTAKEARELKFSVEWHEVATYEATVELHEDDLKEIRQAGYDAADPKDVGDWLEVQNPGWFALMNERIQDWPSTCLEFVSDRTLDNLTVEDEPEPDPIDLQDEARGDLTPGSDK